jgi:dihydropteroate synthase
VADQRIGLDLTPEVHFRPVFPLVMGVVNVTPDSFSDGGCFADAVDAVAHGLELVAAGADVVDVGGESTRPGAEPVPFDEELRRVIPVVEALAGHVRVSIDTMKPAVAEAAVRAGASLVNDVSGSLDLADVAAAHGVGWVCMHMQGSPRSMQHHPTYDDVVAEVNEFLVGRARAARARGVDEVWVDPGIGFGKTLDHNLELIARLDEIVAIGRPVVFGASRKSFLGKLTGRQVDERLAGTIAANIIAHERGARVFRVHDVAPTVDALKVAAATVRRP